jgi:hypothetical protein
MNDKLLRAAYAFEFLLAIVAIFTAWSEIGGQAALDLMHWGFKFGFSLLLALSIVAYTAALVGGESWWSLRSARWLTAILVLIAAMGVVTYFYALQVDTGESDENPNISQLDGLGHCGVGNEGDRQTCRSRGERCGFHSVLWRAQVRLVSPLISWCGGMGGEVRALGNEGDRRLVSQLAMVHRA